MIIFAAKAPKKPLSGSLVTGTALYAFIGNEGQNAAGLTP